MPLKKLIEWLFPSSAPPLPTDEMTAEQFALAVGIKIIPDDEDEYCSLTRTSTRSSSRPRVDLNFFDPPAMPDLPDLYRDDRDTDSNPQEITPRLHTRSQDFPRLNLSNRQEVAKPRLTETDSNTDDDNSKISDSLTLNEMPNSLADSVSSTDSDPRRSDTVVEQKGRFTVTIQQSSHFRPKVFFTNLGNLVSL
jgi:hypothetical protein